MEGDVEVDQKTLPIPSTPPLADVSATSDNQPNAAEEDGDSCRICRGEGTTEQPLFYPCKCNGSIRFVHQECLMEWLAHSQKKYCELCKTPFTFTKLYDNSMPSTLPWALFLQQVIIHGVEAILRNTRYVVVTLVWLCWLPWSIRQVWRGLFWLADGAWVSKARLQEAALSELASVIETGSNTTISNLTTSRAAQVISAQIQLQTSLFSGFVGLFTGDFLLVELAKLIFPSLTRWSQEYVSSEAADDPVILLTMDRQPSLLSNVGFISSLTKYRLINGALVDVLEGQLICLLIVVAFILVFLIREWVLNQQPIANMPDPDNAPEVPGAGNAQDDEERAARRRRRALRRANQIEHAPDAPAAGVQPLGGRPIAVVHPRHRGNTAVADALQDLPNPQGYYNIQADPPTVVAQDTATPVQTPSEAESPAWVDEDETADARPPLPARGAFDNFASIQRGIEEGNIEDVEIPSNYREKLHVADESWTWDDEANGASTEPGINPQAVRSMYDPPETDETDTRVPPSDLFSDDHFYSYSRPLPPPMRTLGTSRDYDLLETSSMEAEASDSDSEQRVGGDDQSNLSLPDATMTTDQVDDAGVDDTDSVVVNTPATPTEDSIPTSAEDANASTLANRSMLETVFDWFWYLDEDLQAESGAQPQIPADDEHVIDNVAAEAPFVHVHNPEQDPVHEPELQAAPAAPAPEPNMLFGVDLNNPDAMEDAEDLDGILELIGMQGPLAGMVQNVIFSEFLITLTIAASVWLPYIWGKIALLIIANPAGVFVRAPLFLASRFADFALDLMLFILGLLGLSVTSLVNALTGLAGDTFEHWQMPEFVNKASSDFTKSSGTRLENSLSNAMTALKPDLPTFSLRSHYALRVSQHRLRSLWAIIDVSIAKWLRYLLQWKDTLLQPTLERQSTLHHAINFMVDLPKQLSAVVLYVSAWVRESLSQPNNYSPVNPQAIDINLVRWNTQDQILAIVLGYLFFACIGFLYLQIARRVLGLRSDEKVEGAVADSLRQAGGVIKVMVIIGIEMIVFPLYCGLLLDAALMPLFEGVTLQTRLAFMLRAPITGVFVHWFIGTCYMFHFALFVSICRKIFRKGVLYFIRDPDDPNFHPVRDVLERPVLTQLGKIAFSGFIYGALVYACLGGVVYVLSCIRGILPIHWSTSQPQLAFPVDIIFYNFLLPFILRKTRPSKKVAAMYEWWFRGCAHGLRLTNFLFGEDRPEEKGTHSSRTLWSRVYSQGPGSSAFSAKVEADLPLADSSAALDFVRDGGYVRAPASDSVRIPKDTRVFLDVNENNERLDGKEDKEKGMHGSKDDRFTLVYTPPHFQARITTFIVLLWLFAATTGVAFTIGPLLIGRAIIQPFASSDIPPNDLYALTIGLHVCGAGLYAIAYYQNARAWLKEHTTSVQARLSFYLYPTTRYLLGLLYLGTATCVLPLIFSLLAELYIHIPLYEYLSSDSEPQELPASSASYFMTLPPTIFLLQTWTVGLVLVRVILREGFGDPETSRPARAIKAITRHGYLNPNVKLATRALFLPATLLAAVLWLAPLALGRILNFLLEIDDAHQRAVVYRYSYPCLASMVMSIFILLAMKRRIAIWRTKIRDEVYLIGERLHNYQETRESNAKGKGSTKVRTERVEVG
jgi:E3 ubiquitin-protein ligase MARCH6